MTLGRITLRLVLGGYFFAHGAQKLFGWFGGHGVEGTGQFFESIGIKPGKRNALAAGVNEAAGGAMVATGFLTPIGATLLISTMIVAIKTVHGPKGPFNTEGGYEYNVVLIAALLALTESGPGSASIDAKLGTEHAGVGLALAALAAGGAGAAAVLAGVEQQTD